MTTRLQIRVAVALLAAVAVGVWIPKAVAAADATFIGALALAVEEEGVRRLALTEETRAKLLQLIDRREQEALNLALTLRDLPPAERTARLTPFVRESERLGMELLTLEQRNVLDQMRTAHSGLASLGEAHIAQVLNLSPDQRTTVERVLTQRAEALQASDARQQREAYNRSEAELMAMLSPEQRAGWERLAGLTPGTATTPANSEPPQPVAASPPAEPAPAAVAENAAVEAPSAAEIAVQATPAPAEQAIPAEKAAPTELATMPEQPATEPAAAAEIGAAAPAATAAPQAAPATPALSAAIQPAPGAPAGSETTEQAAPTGDDARLRFNFRHQPWADVLEWFATQADLSLQMDVAPPGTLNYRDTRTYTPAEALDLMNGVLLTKGFTLVRRNRLLLIINEEDGIPPQFVELVSLKDLEKRGEFELVKCLFHVVKMEVNEAEQEIAKLIGPTGSVVALPKSQQLLVTEMAGRMQTIQKVIERIENPESGMAEGVVQIQLQYVDPETLLTVARTLLGLPEGQNSNESIRIAVDPLGLRLFASGNRAELQKLRDLVPLIDRPSADSSLPLGAIEEPQLETYPIIKADPASVLAVMQTLLAGLPDVRLALEPQSNKLIALARPSEHRTIVGALKQLEGDVEQVEVIQLRKMDPQMVILTLTKLFADAAGGGLGPKVDGDPATRRLWVRGTANQVAQVKDLVEKLEGSDASADGALGDYIRLLPFSGSGAQTALDNAQLLWPALRSNRIRTVTPSAISPSLRERRSSTAEEPPADEGPWYQFEVPSGAAPLLERLLPSERPAGPSAQRTSAQPVFVSWADESAPAAEINASEPAAANSEEDPAVATQSDPTESQTDLSAAQSEAAPAQPAPVAAPEAAAVPPQSDPPQTPALPTQPQAVPSPSDVPRTNLQVIKPPPDIIISRTPTGLVIASQDRQALDEFEALLRSLMEQSQASGEPTIFWLKYAKADVAAEILKQILGGTSSSGGSLVGDVAQNVLGSVGGGILGSLLGGGDSIGLSGPASIVPDVRLNALIVQAAPADLTLIEQLLPIIDRDSSPEDVQTGGKPRLIPVIYMPADEMANIVRTVYADRIAGADSRGGQRMPSPEDFVRALRGGGRDGRSGQSAGEVQKMTIGVDTRSNSLVVAAPDALFKQVEELVAQLDDETIVTDEDFQVINVKGVNPQLLQKTLSSMLGSSARIGGTTSSSSSSSRSSSGSSGSGGPPGGGSAEDIQRRMEFFRSLQQRMGGGGGGPPGGFGGGGPPGGFGGFSGRGGGDASSGRGPTSSGSSRGGGPTRGGSTRGGR